MKIKLEIELGVDGFYFINCPKLNIYCHGDSFRNVFDEFLITLNYFTLYYEKISDDKLTPYAKNLKQLYKQLYQERVRN